MVEALKEGSSPSGDDLAWSRGTCSHDPSCCINKGPGLGRDSAFTSIAATTPSSTARGENQMALPLCKHVGMQMLPLVKVIAVLDLQKCLSRSRKRLSRPLSPAGKESWTKIKPHPLEYCFMHRWHVSIACGSPVLLQLEMPFHQKCLRNLDNLYPVCEMTDSACMRARKMMAGVGRV